MSSRRYYYVMCGILVFVLLLIAGGAVGGNFILQKQSKKLTDLKTQNKSVEGQQSALLQAKKDIEKYSELDEITKSIVPQDKDQAKTVREIVTIAERSSIPIKSVTFENSTLGGSAAATSAPAATKQAPASQLKPVEGISGVYTLEIKVQSDKAVRYQDLLSFLEKLETNRRTAHVSAIDLTPDETGRLLNFNLTLNAYVKP